MGKCKDVLERKTKVDNSQLLFQHQLSDKFVEFFWSTRCFSIRIFILCVLEPKFDTLLLITEFWNIYLVLTAEVGSWDRRMNGCEAAECTLINLEFGGVVISVMG